MNLTIDSITITEKLQRLEVLEQRNARRTETLRKYKNNNLEKARLLNSRNAKKHYDKNKTNEDFRQKKRENALKSYYKKKALTEALNKALDEAIHEALNKTKVLCECSCDEC